MSRVEFLEEADAADALAEETAEHAVLGPDVAIFGRDVLDDVVGRRAQNVFGDIGLLLRNAGRADILLEELDRSATSSIRLANEARSKRRAGARAAVAAAPPRA